MPRSNSNLSIILGCWFVILAFFFIFNSALFGLGNIVFTIFTGMLMIFLNELDKKLIAKRRNAPVQAPSMPNNNDRGQFHTQTQGPIDYNYVKFIPMKNSKQLLIHSELLNDDVRPCCHQTARLNDKYCICGRVILYPIEIQ
ncbi:MAG: hypothetical protein ACW99A_14445 [Candidatus Kariarchaeaceae archaeon]|jgi:hypothetical protein